MTATNHAPGCPCLGACAHWDANVRAQNMIGAVVYEAHQTVVELMVLVNVHGVELARDALEQSVRAFAPMADRLRCPDGCRVHEMARAKRNGEQR